VSECGSKVAPSNLIERRKRVYYQAQKTPNQIRRENYGNKKGKKTFERVAKPTLQKQRAKGPAIGKKHETITERKTVGRIQGKGG